MQTSAAVSVLRVILVAAIYYAAARLGLTWQLPGTNASPAWPPSYLNMPGTDGREVMSEVTQDPDLKLIPIVVLTTSSDERAFVASGAKSDIVKPVTQDGILKAVQRLESV